MIDTRTCRRDLTSRECANIIGGLLGSLHIQALADPTAVREAVRWWAARSDEEWKALADLARAQAAMTDMQVPEDRAVY